MVFPEGRTTFVGRHKSLNYLFYLAARQFALDQFQARPNAARILPAAAGAAQPFTQNRPRRDQATLGFGERAGQRFGLSGGPVLQLNK